MSQTIEMTIGWQTSNGSDVATYLSEVLWSVDDTQAVEHIYEGDVDEQRVVCLHVFLSSLASCEIIEQLLSEDHVLNSAGCLIRGTRQVNEEDWAHSWKSFWHVSRITDRLVICPSWERYEPSERDIVIQLDPGGAFGTGTHETTRLMLQAIETISKENDLSQWSILDLGCGSGILSIYCALLGSKNVRALDIDPRAVQATEVNAVQNHVADSIIAEETPLSEMCRTKYDLVLANISASVLRPLMEDISCRMEPGGFLLISGFVEKSVSQLKDLLTNTGFSGLETYQEGNWFLLMGGYDGDS